MKTISTTVKSGDIINYNGKECEIGVIKGGKIKFTTTISKNSCVTEWITTRELNRRLKTI